MSRRIEEWQVRRTELVLDTPWAKVRRDWCVLPDGTKIDDYYYWEGGDFAQVFAVTGNDEVILVRQYKHGTREIGLELPAGVLNDSDADPLQAAQRELKEETGFTGTEWESLGSMSVSAAKSTARSHSFLVTGATRTSGQMLDATENIEVVVMPLSDLPGAIAAAKIRDSNSVATCFLAFHALERID